jgi:hypothetical protein
MLFSIPDSKFQKGSPIDRIGGKKCVGISSLSCLCFDPLLLVEEIDVERGRVTEQQHIGEDAQIFFSNKRNGHVLCLRSLD